ncbi:MAG TPA: PIG-L family deacetylase [Vicinamibacterales bacterium]|jgi:LmbE family N-acetylglucosaminyl deacetylase|nr:PIG-L family deacetylase [Vicinamibacterales bacterium]
MRRLLIAAAALSAFVLVTDAQVRPIYDMGAAGMTQVLQRLQTTASVLHTGAHPDDEDSAFIARAARGDHARVAYVSLNRGEGGQNIIGTELFDALGVIRTEELLQARRLDGAEQYFGHTFDYGFSKSRAEAAMKWGERDTLGDYVRVIRLFRPLVIYSRFSGTPADGHGHHQEAGYLTPLAYKAAADPNQFPEQLREGLRPWQAKKLYRGIGFNARPDPAASNVQVQEGIVDPAAGRSYAEISFEGRSQHKTQAQGGIEPRGPLASTLLLMDSGVQSPRPEKSIFDGLDTTIPGLAKLAGLPDGTIRLELGAMDTAAKKALADYQALAPARIIPALADGLRAARVARATLRTSGGSADARADADFLLSFKENDFTEALVRAAEVDLDPLASQETVVPGDPVDVLVRMFFPAESNVTVKNVTINAPEGWRVEPLPADTAPAGGGGFGRRETPSSVSSYRLYVPADAPVTEPYYLKRPRTGDVYAWADGDPKSRPFGPPLITASVALTIRGIDMTITRPVQFRYADSVRGELRRDVNVVPRMAVGLDTPLLVVPLGTTANQQKLVVRATSFSPKPVTGTLRLRLPQGWTATPAQASFTLNASGDRTSTPFVVTAPAQRTAGRLEIGAEAVEEGATFTRDVEVIAYPHIQTHRLYWPATATAQVFDLKVAPVKVGYIMGSGDQVADAIRRMGVEVTMLDGDMLATGDLSRFDTIVVGIRASEANPDFVANNGRVLDYLQRGGTLIVQYQQQEYANRKMPPFPAGPPTNANPRVTVEDAPVKILVPTHPAFNFPNKITDADFAGWVQERNAYAFSMFDARYVPLLETADPGEPPVRGAEVYAEVGKGRYVYTAYSWFRQLPAGVPGAYRQFANLISLSKAPR